MQKKHAIQTCKMLDNQMYCINRDHNAVNNMIRIVHDFLNNLPRPLRFHRSYKLPETIQDTNPIRATSLIDPHDVLL